MDAKWLVELSGRTYPLYGGVLAEAHDRGVKCISVDLVQIPGPDNEYTAIVKATVILENGETFSDYGDASPRNTKQHLHGALIRLASTRAKGRALRDSVNIGQTMLEELPDLDEPPAPANGKARAHAAVTAAETQEMAARVTRPTPPPPKPPADPDPGFEAWFDAGGKHKHQRVSLISAYLTDVGLAQERGVPVQPLDPETTPNAALFEQGRLLRKRLTAAKDARDQEQIDTAGGARHDAAH